jgi:hypothetical protein
VKIAKAGFLLYMLGSVVFGLILLYALFSGR